MLYAMVVVFGSYVSGEPPDLYFYDVRGFQDMKKCEDAKIQTQTYIKMIHPWVKIVRGSCVPETFDGLNAETSSPPSP